MIVRVLNQAFHAVFVSKYSNSLGRYPEYFPQFGILFRTNKEMFLILIFSFAIYLFHFLLISFLARKPDK